MEPTWCTFHSIYWESISVSLRPCHNQLTYARNIPNAVCVTPPGDEKVVGNMWRPLILNKLNEQCITLVWLYWLTDTFLPYATFDLLNPRPQHTAKCQHCTETILQVVTLATKQNTFDFTDSVELRKIQTSCRIFHACYRTVADLSPNTESLFYLCFVSLVWIRPKTPPPLANSHSNISSLYAPALLM
jgi:hypothetical protein